MVLKKNQTATSRSIKLVYLSNLPNDHGVLIGSFLALLRVQTSEATRPIAKQPPWNLKQPVRRRCRRRTSSAAAAVKLANKRSEIAGRPLAIPTIYFFLLCISGTGQHRVAFTHLILDSIFYLSSSNPTFFSKVC